MTKGWNLFQVFWTVHLELTIIAVDVSWQPREGLSSQRERNLLPIRRTSSFSWGASGDRQSDSCWQSAKKERERLGWRWEIGHPARDLTDKEETRERIFFWSLSFKSATALWRWWIPCRQLASLRGTLSRRESEEIAFFLFGEKKKWQRWNRRWNSVADAFEEDFKRWFKNWEKQKNEKVCVCPWDSVCVDECVCVWNVGKVGGMEQEVLWSSFLREENVEHVSSA